VTGVTAPSSSRSGPRASAVRATSVVAAASRGRGVEITRVSSLSTIAASRGPNSTW
jgi:hypothetical protein